MKYNDLIQLYFERTTALQNYWTLYVVIVGGLLAFSSLRKQPAALTTLIVSILFGLFAYENLHAIHPSDQRHPHHRGALGHGIAPPEECGDRGGGGPAFSLTDHVQIAQPD